jgi:hypothetical protein
LKNIAGVAERGCEQANDGIQAVEPEHAGTPAALIVTRIAADLEDMVAENGDEALPVGRGQEGQWLVAGLECAEIQLGLAACGGGSGIRQCRLPSVEAEPAGRVRICGMKTETRQPSALCPERGRLVKKS